MGAREPASTPLRRRVDVAPTTYASRRAVATRFVSYLSVVAVAILLVGWPIYARYEAGLRDAAVEAELRSIDNAEQIVHDEMFSITREIRSLTRVPDVRAYLQAPNDIARNALEAFFADLSRNLLRYDQMRIFDLTGHERIRINDRDGVPTVVSPANLQDKSGRYYTREMLELDVGEVYVSRLDLNVDGGVVEVPLIPTLRFGMVVPGDDGRPVGLVMLNYRGRLLLDTIEELLGEDLGHEHLLTNREGYFLLAPEDGLAWGWMLDRPGATLEGRYPELADAVVAADRVGERSATVAVPDGLAVIRFFDPLAFRISNMPGARTAADLEIAPASLDRMRWTFVSILPDEVVLASSPLRQPIGWFTAIVLAVLLIVASYAVASARAEQRAFQRVRDGDLQEIEDLYENAPIGYHTTDAEGRIHRINATELAWLGYERDEVVGRMRLSDLIAPESQASAAAFLEQVRHQGHVADVPLLLLRKDGTTLPVAFSSSSRTSASGQFAVARTSVVDISDRRRLETELTRQANTDALTGILNRRRFFEVSSVALARTRNAGTPLSLLQLDVDHFKSVNDRFGHQAGDAALKAVTAVCASELRDRDLFARIGGEEFAILLPGATRAKALEIAERVRSAVERATLDVDRAGEVRLTCSIGVAQASMDDHDLETLMKRADDRLYEAKRRGRNRIAG